MELLRTIKEEKVYPEYKSDKDKKNKYRAAVRAIVLDGDNKVALINVTKLGYYKLPGGGVEDGESVEEALKRECLEEVGCDVDVGEEIGKVMEHRDRIETNQESFCYLAKAVGDKGQPSLVGYEITDGFEPVWVDIDEALSLVEHSKPTSYDGPFIKIRDFTFLKKAKEILK